MLFNSFGFIFLFLPACLFGFFAIGRRSARLAECWLLAASLVFYAWWSFEFLWLLIGSIAFNFSISTLLLRGTLRAKLVLTAGVAANLLVLVIFKYLDLLLGALNATTLVTFELPHLTLPIGISFYTFTQIAYLVDTYQGLTRDRQIVRYSLFVTYFPHLIAGPILHHKPTMQQFSRPETYILNWQNILIGLSYFAIGLSKKVLIADNLAPYVIPVFEHSGAGGTVGFWAGWTAAICYTFQLYFDFSGYSDMAVGLSRLFGVKIPINFLSPYKSKNMIEFWRRWHISLSTFLRDYLYIPLGGNRFGVLARYRNLIITMALGGLWHGSNWTFLIWGLLHGGYLAINHFWQLAAPRMFSTAKPTFLGGLAGASVTFLAVVVGWVFFRSDNLAGAFNILSGMTGFNGVSATLSFVDVFNVLRSGGINLQAIDGLFAGDPILANQGAIALIVILPLAMSIAFLAPNCFELMEDLERKTADLSTADFWRTSVWVTSIGCLLGISICFLNDVTPFLYFQF